MSDQLKETIDELFETGNAWIDADSDLSVGRVKYEVEEETHGQKTVRKGREKTEEFSPWGKEICSEEEVVLIDRTTAREKQRWKDEQVEQNQARELGPDSYTGPDIRSPREMVPRHLSDGAAEYASLFRGSKARACSGQSCATALDLWSNIHDWFECHRN